MRPTEIPTTKPLRAGLAASLVGIVGTLLTGVVAWDLWESERARHAAYSERLADNAAANVVRETDLALALQTAVAAKMTTDPSTRAGVFLEFVDSTRLFEILPSVRAVAYAPLVRAGALADFARTIEADASRAQNGYPPFRVWPEGARERYAPATLVAPVAGNEAVFGFDALSNPERRAAIEAAIREWRPKASAPVVLTQDRETRGPGILVVRPVGTRGAPSGVIAMGITIERLLRPLELGSGARVEIDDVGDASGTREPALVFRGGAPSAQAAVERTIDVAGRKWRLRVSPPTGPQVENVALTTLVGLLLSGLGVLAAWRALATRADLEATVQARTRDLREAGAALAAANAELRDQARDLARANATKAEFLGRLGHELRTPLNAIIGFAEMLRMGLVGPLSHKQTAYLNDIHGAGDHLLALVNRLLELVKLERSEVALERVAFDPRAEVVSVIAMLQIAAGAKHVEIRFEDTTPPEPERFAVLGDRLAFRQITANLLENAIKFSHDGAAVRLALAREGDDVILEVDDKGVGIPADQLALVFEPFHQAEIGDARRFGGAGLGLSIVRGLAERMGGRVEVTSEVGRGSRFRVRLPALDTVGAAAPAKVA